MISGLDSGRPASKRVATTNIVNFLNQSYNYPSWFNLKYIIYW